MYWLVLLFCFSVQASEDRYKTLTSAGLDHAYNLHFDEATDIFTQLIQLQPDNPRGYLLQSINFYYRYQLEENHENFARQFLYFSQKAIATAKRVASRDTEKLDALFYLGTAHIYLAAYHGWENNWWKAYWYGKEGIAYLERLVQLEPTYYDAYLGLGLYHYYTDIIPRVAKAVGYVLGLDNDREKGLKELKLAAQYGTYSREEALFFLGSIYLYLEKDFNKAMGYFQRLVILYPENSSFLMMLGENYQKVGKTKEAADTLNQLVSGDKATRFPVLIISSYYRLGNLYFGMRDLPKAIQSYTKCLKLASLSTGNVSWVFALANLNLGRSYDLLGRRKDAAHYYKRVKETDHKHAYKIAQARIKKAQGKEQARQSHNQEEIVSIYREALAKVNASNTGGSGSNVPELHYHIGRAFYEKAAYSVAINKFDKIIASTSPTEPWLKPWTQYYLGNCYLKVGKFKKAAEAYGLAYQYNDPELRSRITRKQANFSIIPVTN